MKNSWTEQYDKNDMMWPTESLIRMFKGRHYPNSSLYNNEFTNATILDVGCGDANNFLLYNQLGFKKICGVEITEEICKINKERLNRLGIQSEMRVGTNNNIPYSEEFDYLVSWNACYYMGGGKTITFYLKSTCKNSRLN
jgi:ubiquinone/menaquinone biosynthesis C-methylase UbiE